MKKILILIFLFILTAGLFANDNRYEDKEIPELSLSTEDLEGRAKAGLAIGYPFGLTFGYRLANYLEANAFAGTHFNSDFAMGANLLFTIVNINMGDEIFPLSMGPALYCDFDDEFSMAAGATVRWEYTFDEVPLNLYIEATPGLQFMNDFGFYLASSFGVRYVF